VFISRPKDAIDAAVPLSVPYRISFPEWSCSLHSSSAEVQRSSELTEGVMTAEHNMTTCI